MSEVIIYDKHFVQIDRQDWPDKVGTIFVTKMARSNNWAKEWVVSEWVDCPHDNVMSLGEFWKKEDAIIFANAKAELTAPERK